MFRKVHDDVVHPIVQLVSMQLHAYATMQVCIVSVCSSGIRVLSHAWDSSLGGHDLDVLLMNHFAKEFQEQTGLQADVTANPKSQVRMAKAVSKCRQLLTVSPEADVSVDSFIGDLHLECVSLWHPAWTAPVPVPRPVLDF